jgi:hypothetical protein
MVKPRELMSIALAGVMLLSAASCSLLDQYEVLIPQPYYPITFSYRY